MPPKGRIRKNAPTYALTKRSKKLRLTADERLWIQHRIEKMKKHERTQMEERLLSKVK